MVSNPKPMHPGKVLEGYYMAEMGLSQSELARRLGCAPRKINEIINGKRGISPGFALDLEAVLGTTADMWVSMQAAFDLWQERQKRKAA